MNNMELKQLNGYQPTWCPGCGNWSIDIAVKKSLINLQIAPQAVCIAFDIGCSGNMADFINCYGIHTLHGRALSTAIGIQLAQPDLYTLVVGGDGGIYGEGGNHFLHACRANHNLTVLVHDNRVYGLTTGQTAPTAAHGYRSKSTPFGMAEQAITPLTLAISQGATFVAQAFAGDMITLTEIISQAISHRGFSLVNILQPCVTFNKVDTYQSYLKSSYKLPPEYNVHDKTQAMIKGMEVLENKFPIGILYQEERPTYGDALSCDKISKSVFLQKHWGLQINTS